MDNQSDSKNAVGTLARNGKSFRFAGRFLDDSTLENAARLYSFCRWVDDLADNSSENEKKSVEVQLKRLQQQIVSGIGETPEACDIIDLQRQLNIPPAQPNNLIDGVLTDLNPVRIVNQDELIRYAYLVAGVVGLMMCAVLKADKRGYAHAIDLGIAMQLTNIARDVWEDAQMGRRYLPATWCDVSPEKIVENNPITQAQVQNAIKKLLLLSEQYYESGRQGLQYLPSKNRRAITVAAAVYREIGIKLSRKKLRYWHGRTVLSTPEKCSVAGKTLLKSYFSSDQHKPHDLTLHKSLSEL